MQSAYGELLYFLTGEHREYDRGNGRVHASGAEPPAGVVAVRVHWLRGLAGGRPVQLTST